MAYPRAAAALGLDSLASSPIPAYRWEYTDRALAEQLKLEDEGHPATVGHGHATIRHSNPTTGGDVTPTIRAEFHRLRAGAATRPRHDNVDFISIIEENKRNMAVSPIFDESIWALAPSRMN